MRRCLLFDYHFFSSSSVVLCFCFGLDRFASVSLVILSITQAVHNKQSHRRCCHFHSRHRHRHCRCRCRCRYIYIHFRLIAIRLLYLTFLRHMDRESSYRRRCRRFFHPILNFLELKQQRINNNNDLRRRPIWHVCLCHSHEYPTKSINLFIKTRNQLRIKPQRRHRRCRRRCRCCCCRRFRQTELRNCFNFISTKRIAVERRDFG